MMRDLVQKLRVTWVVFQHFEFPPPKKHIKDLRNLPRLEFEPTPEKNKTPLDASLLQNVPDIAQSVHLWEPSPSEQS